VTEYCIDVGYSIDGNKFKFNTVGWATLAVFDLMQLYGWDDPLWSSHRREPGRGRTLGRAGLQRPGARS